MQQLPFSAQLNRDPAHRGDKLKFSFEFFPPKTAVMEGRFWGALHRLARLEPEFASVTYGAGGSTRERTMRIASRITEETNIPTAAHITCVGATRDEVNKVIEGFAEAGIKRVVALRGDPQGGIGTKYEPHPDGYANAAELVAGIRKIGDFDISVAAYPEKHPESPDWDADIDNLKRKIDAGANRAITQMFFDNDDYWRFMERVEKAGITAPVIPGVQPIHNYKQISSFAGSCGARVPDWLAKCFDDLDEEPEIHSLVASALAVEQVIGLINGGVRAFHFYTLNRADLVVALSRVLGQVRV